MPQRPEEVGEFWLPKRKGFDVRNWRPKCRCGHSHEDHDFGAFLLLSIGLKIKGTPYDPNSFQCRACVWETEEERQKEGKVVGTDYMPLAGTPEIRDAFASSGSSFQRALPFCAKPERSVRLMEERCANYRR